MIDSIIFDLDGTLWNACSGSVKVWDKVLEKYPLVNKKITKEEIGSCMGLTIDKVGEKMFPELDTEMQMKLMKAYCESEVKYLGEVGGTLYPLVEETLEELSKEYKLFIVSNCQDGYIQCFFKAHNLEKYFTDFECYGATGLSKGENNILIIERNNLKNPVYVGDTDGDAESAIVAKIPFIYASYGFGHVDEKKYNYLLDDFCNLKRILSNNIE